ncbi:LPXTG cell wall anchor domain-containing protein, partial [Aerococcus urinae]
ISETFVKDGQDGKSPEVTTKDNGNGTHTITIKNPDGTTTTTTVKDGAKGDKGEKGQDGTNGVDGKTYAPVVERGQDGTTIIKFYPVDPKTGKVDKSQEPVATGEVKDGAQGAAGQDGKSSYTTVVTGPNDAGEQGQWIINYYDKNGDGKFTDDEMVSAKFVRDGKDGKSPEVTTKDNGNGTHTITIKNPDGTTTTTTVKDGKDGKAPVVETSRVEDADPNTPDNQPGTKITVKDPDTGKVINETFVKDGKDGKDGQSYAPVVEKGQDGTTTIKFYPVDPKTGKADTTQPAVAEGTVKDGANGKSAYTTVVEGPNAAGEPGRWIINYFDKNNDGKFTDDEVVSAQFVRDGKDGQSPTVEVKDNGDGTHTITTKNPDGSVNSTTTVKNGKDGKSPVVESTRVEDADPNTPGNQAGTKITVKDPETGKVISETFVKDGVNGKDGKDGKNGIDGKSFAPVVEKGQDGTTTIKFYPVDPKTGKPDTTQAPVAEGSVKDGKDGKSPEVTTKDNGDGTHTITIKNPDGTTTTTTVKDGKDGKTPEVGVKDNGDGSHTITIKNPDGTTTTTTVRDGKNGQNGKDGIDGKTFAPVVEKGQDGTTTIKFYPVDPKTGKPDTTQPAVAEGSVKDGKDGKSPEVTTTDNGDGTHTITIKNPDGTTTTTTVKDGKDGRDGIDGKTFAPVVEKGQDGTTTIKFYPVDPKTGKPDTSQPAVAEGSVKDGRDGKDGKDGRSERIRTEKGKDSQGNEGVWVIITDDKGNELSREFIRDGKTPSVKVEEGKNSRGESGQWIIVFDGDGNEVSREFVRDGKDGASSSLETVPGKNEKGESGLWVIVKDGQGNESSRHFVRDGKDGKDGKDGRSVQKIYNREGKLIIIFSDHTTEEIEIPCCKSCPESPRTPKPGDPTPDVPGQPEKPDQPDQPEVPEPGEPEEPGQPDQPEVPVPGQPDQPEVPEPSEPEEPGQPNQPEKPVPGDPTPEVPTVPADPEKPGQPDQPKVPVPGNPTSEVPNVPAEPRPEVPNQPSDPAPQVPGQADPDNSFKTKDNKLVTNKEQDDQNKQASLPATGAEVTSAMTVIIASLLLSSGALLVKNNKKD